MQSETEIVLESSPDIQDAEAEKSLPFSFAKRHGVLIRDYSIDSADLVYRTGTSPLSLAEARRFVGVPVKLSVFLTRYWAPFLF